MSRKSMSARHRATPTTSIALQGLSYSLKSNAASIAKPAAAAAAASGLLFGVGAPAHAGAYAPETPGTTSAQVQAAPQAPAVPSLAKVVPRRILRPLQGPAWQEHHTPSHPATHWERSRHATALPLMQYSQRTASRWPR